MSVEGVHLRQQELYHRIQSQSVHLKEKSKPLLCSTLQQKQLQRLQPTPLPLPLPLLPELSKQSKNAPPPRHHPRLPDPRPPPSRHHRTIGPVLALHGLPRVPHIAVLWDGVVRLSPIHPHTLPLYISLSHIRTRGLTSNLSASLRLFSSTPFSSQS